MGKRLGEMDYLPMAPVTAPSILTVSSGEGQPTKVLQILK